MTWSPSTVKQSCPMNDLKESDLEEIFKRLPPFERLLVSEVCRRWYEISRKAWLDLKTLDLSPIPGKHIRTIVNQSPNLQSVFAVGKSFAANELACLADVATLSCVFFCACDFQLNSNTSSIVRNIFSDHLEQAVWKELTLLDAKFLAPGLSGVLHLGSFDFDATILPLSLTRLNLSGLYLRALFHDEPAHSLDGLERLENLECFILHTIDKRQRESGLYDLTHYDLIGDCLEKISRLKNLRELSLGPAYRLERDNDKDRSLGHLVSSLPKLEVLLLNDLIVDELADDLKDIVQSNSVLRSLVLSGKFVPFDCDDEKIVLPARKRFPKGFGSDPLPLLHIFVGRQASENITFQKSSSDAAIIHPINAPMPEFLKREDIALIFEGVWVAERIKEAAENGARLWDYALYDDASSVQHPDE